MLRTMDEAQAMIAFAALGNDVRFAVFRMLLPHGSEGLGAGIIAESVGLLPSTLSHHLRAMTMAGLLRQRRVRRNFVYAVDIDAAKTLAGFLSAAPASPIAPLEAPEDAIVFSQGVLVAVRRDVAAIANDSPAAAMIAEATLTEAALTTTVNAGDNAC